MSTKFCNENGVEQRRFEYSSGFYFKFVISSHIDSKNLKLGVILSDGDTKTQFASALYRIDPMRKDEKRSMQLYLKPKFLHPGKYFWYISLTPEIQSYGGYDILRELRFDIVFDNTEGESGDTIASSYVGYVKLPMKLVSDA